MAISKKKPARSSGESLGHNRPASKGAGNVVISGNPDNSMSISGDYNRNHASSKFNTIYALVKDRADLSDADKSSLKTELETFEAEDKKGPESNEGFLAQRLRNFRRGAPDLLDVVIATIANPAAGFGVIAKKVAEKMKAEAK